MSEKKASSDIQDFLDWNERQPGERVLGVTAYGPASTLIVSNQRIIGKTHDQNPNIFQGSLEYADILAVGFSPGMPVFGVPSLSLEYRASGDKPTQVTFQFPGRLFGHLLYRLSGSDPRAIYLLILEQVDKTKNRAGAA